MTDLNSEIQSNSVYEWAYKIDMLKDNTFLKATIVVMTISSSFVGLFMFFLTLSDGLLLALKVSAIIFAGLAAGFFVLGIIAFYLVYVPVMGRYYGVIFKLDDKTAQFITDKNSKMKERKIANIAIAAGIAFMNPTLMGQGFINNSRTSMTTSLKNVTKVVFKPSIKRITLVENRLAVNYIYVPDELWDTVEKHFAEKCTKAKVIYK